MPARRGDASLREYVERMMLSERERETEAELCSCMRRFRASPSIAALRQLADVLSRTDHVERAAEAWRYIAHARPNDSEACAAAKRALSRLAESCPEKSPAPVQGGSSEHTPTAVSGVYPARDVHDGPPQGSGRKSRKHL